MHFAYKRPDGGVSVVHLAPKARLEGESDADFLTRVKAQVLPPDALDVVDNPPLPTRTYRESWELTGGAVQHNMVKASAEKMAEIRAERNARLAATDGPFMAAQEKGDVAETARLKVLRQRLRDVPQTVVLPPAADAEALKAFDPVWPV